MDKKQQEAKIIRIAAELFPFVQQQNTVCAEFLTLRAKLTDGVGLYLLSIRKKLKMPRLKSWNV